MRQEARQGRDRKQDRGETGSDTGGETGSETSHLVKLSLPDILHLMLDRMHAVNVY